MNWGKSHALQLAYVDVCSQCLFVEDVDDARDDHLGRVSQVQVDVILE